MKSMIYVPRFIKKLNNKEKNHLLSDIFKKLTLSSSLDENTNENRDIDKLIVEEISILFQNYCSNVFGEECSIDNSRFNEYEIHPTANICEYSKISKFQESEEFSNYLETLSNEKLGTEDSENYVLYFIGKNMKYLAFSTDWLFILISRAYTVRLAIEVLKIFINSSNIYCEMIRKSLISPNLSSKRSLSSLVILLLKCYKIEQLRNIANFFGREYIGGKFIPYNTKNSLSNEELEKLNWFLALCGESERDELLRNLLIQLGAKISERHIKKRKLFEEYGKLKEQEAMYSRDFSKELSCIEMDMKSSEWVIFDEELEEIKKTGSSLWSRKFSMKYNWCLELDGRNYLYVHGIFNKKVNRGDSDLRDLDTVKLTKESVTCNEEVFHKNLCFVKFRTVKEEEKRMNRVVGMSFLGKTCVEDLKYVIIRFSPVFVGY